MEESVCQLEAAPLDVRQGVRRRPRPLEGRASRDEERTGERRRRQPPAGGARARRGARTVAAVASALLIACAGPPPDGGDLVAAAIRARGGPLESFTRESRLVVHYGFPGSWGWEIAFHEPDRFRLALETTADTQTLVSDGETLRTYLGGAVVSEEPAPGPCATTLAHWLAATTLDALTSPEVAWRELPSAELPSGAHRGLETDCAERGRDARYRLFFDRSLQLVAASGPISIPTIGTGRLAARFSDLRARDGLQVPYRIDYRLDGQRFVEETVVGFRRGARLAPEP